MSVIEVRQADLSDEISLAKFHMMMSKRCLRRMYGADFLNGVVGLPVFKRKWKEWLSDTDKATLIVERIGPKSRLILGCIMLHIDNASSVDQLSAEICFSYFSTAIDLSGAEYLLYQAAFDFLKKQGVQKTYIWLFENQLQHSDLLYQAVCEKVSCSERIHEISGFGFHEVQYAFTSIT